MRIGIDGWYLRVPRGIGNSALDLIRELPNWRPSWVFLVYVPASYQPPAAFLAMSNLQFRTLPSVPYPLWEQVVLPLAASRDRVDLLHSVGNTGPVWLPSRTKLVVTIHDTLYMRRADEGVDASSTTYQRVGRRYRRIVAPRVARRADRIITVSEASRVDICANLSVPAAKVIVVPSAPSSDFHPLPREVCLARLPTVLRRRRSPWIVALGASDPRKNTVRVVQAFAELAAENPQPELIVLGLSEVATSKLTSRVSDPRIRRRILSLGFITRHELVALYGAASVLLYPSLGEGFGLPILEAMACGTPVITSRRGALLEVAGTAALYVDPTSTTAIVEALQRICADPGLGKRYREEGLARASGFSWRRAAKQTLEVYATS
jgi:glycosyltransferase involved in cell wall biosynthesis